MNDRVAYSLAMLTYPARFLNVMPGRGIPEKTALEVSAGLAGLNDYIVAAMRAYYVDDVSCRQSLINYLADDAITRYSIKEPHKAQSVAQIAIMHVFGEAKCATCSGRGEVWSRQRLPRRCERCSGFGLKPLSARSQARMLGIDESTFRECWPHKIHRTEMLLADWLRIGATHLLRQLSDRPTY